MSKDSGFFKTFKNLYQSDTTSDNSYTPRYVVPCQRGLNCCTNATHNHHITADISDKKSKMVSSAAQTDYKLIFLPPKKQFETQWTIENKNLPKSTDTDDQSTDQSDQIDADLIDNQFPIGSNPPPIAPPPPPPLINGMKISPVGNYAKLIELRKPEIFPRTPMIPIFWKRLLIGENEDSIWNSINLELEFDEEEFCERFGKQTGLPNTFRKSESLASVDSNSGIKLITLKKAHILDAKKSKALAILLHGQRLDINDITTALMTLDIDEIPIEIVQTVYEHRPSATELKSIAEHLETFESKTLDRPEKFVYQLSTIPHYEQRLWIVMFCSQFPEKLDVISRKILTFNDVCESLLWSQQLHNILATTLNLGNYMNGGNRYRGRADGFSIEILPKLKDIKSQKVGETLLDYICRICSQKDTNFLQSLPDSLDCLEAASFKGDLVAKDLQQLQTQLDQFRLRLDLIFTDTNGTDLLMAMNLNYEKGQSAIDEIKNNLEKSQSTWDRVEMFYGVQQDVTSAEEFFKIWSSFVHDIHHTMHKTVSTSPFGLL